jgi:hypothetical protein
MTSGFLQITINHLTTKPIREICVISGCGKMFNQIHPFMQNKPNYRKHKINAKLYSTKTYEKISHLALPKNKAEQSQF